MRIFMLLATLLWLTAGRAPAKDSAEVLVTATQAHSWQAVGRVNLADTGFCTGTLIAPDLVLTAAHCIFDKKTGKRISTREIVFLAGWRAGRATATRRAQRVVIHKDYVYENTKRLERVAADIALIELDHPIRNTQIVPFGWSKRPRIGENVEIVSYAQDHSDTQSIQESCRVLGRDIRVVVLSCQVNFGASGSPIFVVEHGIPRITSVVSAKAEWNDQRVALGAALGEPLKELIDLLHKTDGVFRQTAPKVATLRDLTNASPGGSKFLKP